MSYPDTQREAWDSIQETLPTSRLEVFKHIACFGAFGVTTMMVASRLGWPINCVSGRITELAKSGLIKDSGRRGINHSGKKAILWVLAKENC